MSVRRAIAEAALEGLNVSEFCRQHGVSRWLFYELRRRFQAEGEAGLTLRSRAARTITNRISVVVEEAIVSERKQLAEQGWDAGPATILFHLPKRLEPGTPLPSEATIWRVLSRRGFITPQPKKAPNHSYRSFAAERANDCWQIDDTEWFLADGTAVRIIDVIDDCTRVAVASVAVTTANNANVLAAFWRGGEQWGWPAGFLSDNAKAFRFGLASALRELGISAGHSRPYHPQTCGKVERFHQTLKKFLTAQPPAAAIGELQTQLDSFVEHYNHRRPHRSLGRRIPAEVFATTPKSGPAAHPLGTATTTHQIRVRAGTLNVGGYQIAVGAAHNHTEATVIITDTDCHVFIEGKLIRMLTLDPTRRSQPIHPHRGRPPTK